MTAEQRAERRERWGITDTPPVAVVTRSGQLPASLFADGPQRPLLVTTAELARTRADLRQRADLLLTGETEVDLSAAVERLRARGLQRILCEGGPTLLDELVAADLVDEMCLTVSPTLAAERVGARHGAPIDTPTRLTLRHCLTDGNYVYLWYSRA